MVAHLYTMSIYRQHMNCKVENDVWIDDDTSFYTTGWVNKNWMCDGKRGVLKIKYNFYFHKVLIKQVIGNLINERNLYK